MTRHLGIGAIGSNFVTPSHRVRWFFEGKNEGGAVVFPLHSVRISNRPQSLELVAENYFNSIDITVFESGLQLPFLAIPSSIHKGILKCYDSLGTIIETYELDLCEVVSLEHNLVDETIEMHLTYRAAKYTSFWFPVPEVPAQIVLFEESDGK